MRVQNGDERIVVFTGGGETQARLAAGTATGGMRAVDVYAYYESARRALFSDRIVEFLRAIFNDSPLLFQSLTFERGSQQPLHQDTGFVVVSSPLEFAASWIALEDIQPGSGELTFIDGSHRLSEYLFSGKYKHWNAKRDGDQQHADWHDQLHANATRLGLEQKTFLASKGDVLIWAADLAHGGSAVTDPSLTSQELGRPLLPKPDRAVLLQARSCPQRQVRARGKLLREPLLPPWRLAAAIRPPAFPPEPRRPPASGAPWNAARGTRRCRAASAARTRSPDRRALR